MAYSEALAQRVRKALARRKGIAERKMFGGLAFLYRGNMMVGVLGDRLVARVSPERYEALLKRPEVSKMDFTGRPLKGFLYVGPKALAGTGLRRWLDEAGRFAASLPEK